MKAATRGCRVVVLVAILAGCSSPGPQISSSSHWITCRTNDDCTSVSAAFTCEDGYCVDPNNGRAVSSNSGKLGQSAVGSDGNDAGASAASAPDIDAGAFNASSNTGAMLTISGSLMSGSYDLSTSLGCGGTFVWNYSGASSSGKFEVDVVGTEPAAGVVVDSPNVKIALTFATADDGTYPANGQGRCSFSGESGSGNQVHGRFACESLIGIGSKKPFSLAGAINCP